MAQVPRMPEQQGAKQRGAAPSVSVVIPVFDHARVLARAIEGVRAQTDARAGRLLGQRRGILRVSAVCSALPSRDPRSAGRGI